MQEKRSQTEDEFLRAYADALFEIWCKQTGREEYLAVISSTEAKKEQ